jgi:hypothetical protein
MASISAVPNMSRNSSDSKTVLPMQPLLRDQEPPILFVRSIIDSLGGIEKVLFADANAKESPPRDSSRRSANDCKIGQSALMEIGAVQDSRATRP